MPLRLPLTFWLLLFSFGGLSPLAVPAQDQSEPPSQHRSSVRSFSSVPLEAVTAPTLEAITPTDPQTSRRETPRRYGRVLSTEFSARRDGRWEQLPSGDWLWRLRIQAQNAVSLSATFTDIHLPEGSALFVYGPDTDVVRGPYNRNDLTGEELWTPLIPSSEVVVELKVPAERRSAAVLTIGKVVHGDRPLSPRPSADGPAKAGACNLDVACEEADPWDKQVRSVARYSYEGEDGHAWTCSGSLVNTIGTSNPLYFLTAAHCVSTPETAASMVFYWDYENSTCREPGTNGNGTETSTSLSRHTSTGALLRARKHAEADTALGSDLSLVEIDDVIPPEYNLYLSGWDRSGTPPEASTTIHHPKGDGKRISFDDDPATITGYLDETRGNSHFRIGNWDAGTTENGSSGAPLFDSNQRIVGVLSGGYAGCQSAARDNDRPDWFGRISPGFTAGDYTPSGFAQASTLTDFLDPNNTGRTTIAGAPLATDSIPPGSVSDFRVSEVTADSVTLQWTAPGDDGMSGRVAEYILRYRAQNPISTDRDFETAKDISSLFLLPRRKAAALPTPQEAGRQQSVTLPVRRDTSYFFGLVAVDRRGNRSALATTQHEVTPVSNLRVTSPPAPNPARDRVTMRFAVEAPQTIRVALYDPLGRRLRTVMRDDVLPFRQHRTTIGLSSLSSGVYFVRIIGERATRTERIAVVK